MRFLKILISALLIFSLTACSLPGGKLDDGAGKTQADQTYISAGTMTAADAAKICPIVNQYAVRALESFPELTVNYVQVYENDLGVDGCIDCRIYTSGMSKLSNEERLSAVRAVWDIESYDVLKDADLLGVYMLFFYIYDGEKWWSCDDSYETGNTILYHGDEIICEWEKDQ